MRCEAALLAVALTACADDSADPPALGTAHFTLGSATGRATPNITPFVGDQLSSLVSHECSGIDIPAISDDTCKDAHVLTALMGARTIRITRPLTAAPPDGPLEIHADPNAPFTASLVDGASATDWESDHAPHPGGSLAITVAGAQVTFQLDKVALGDSLRQSSVELTGTIVLDCASKGEGAVLCAGTTGRTSDAAARDKLN